MENLYFCIINNLNNFSLAPSLAKLMQFLKSISYCAISPDSNQINS